MSIRKAVGESQGIVMIDATRKERDKTTSQSRYFISSLQISAAQMMKQASTLGD